VFEVAWFEQKTWTCIHILCAALVAVHANRRKRPHDQGDRGSSQYFKTFLEDIGFVAPAGTTSEDADDRVLTVGLPRWLPRFYSDVESQRLRLVPYHSTGGLETFLLEMLDSGSNSSKPEAKTAISLAEHLNYQLCLAQADYLAQREKSERRF
jgi:hypothetical protein